MTDHEEAAMEEAKRLRATESSTVWNSVAQRAFELGWIARGEYQSPAVCGERGAGGGLRCVLHAGHDGDHRAEGWWDGQYIGWPREQEPERPASFRDSFVGPHTMQPDASTVAREWVPPRTEMCVDCESGLAADSFVDGVRAMRCACGAEYFDDEQAKSYVKQRKAEPDPDERCAYYQTTRDCGPCNVRREDHDTWSAFNAHPFVSAKEATK